MSSVEKTPASQSAGDVPVGTVNVVNPSPLNWLYITYNTVEELVRTDPEGHVVPAAMQSYSWADGGRTFEVELRPENYFQDGEPLTAEAVKHNFDECLRWLALHPPGTHFNPPPGTTCEVTGEHSVSIRMPEPDGMLLGKLRAFHIMSRRFWEEVGFGYERNGSGEGHW